MVKKQIQILILTWSWNFVSVYFHVGTTFLNCSFTLRVAICGIVYFPIHTHTNIQIEREIKLTNKQTNNAHLGKYHKLHSTYAIHHAHIHSLDTEAFLAHVKMCTQKYSKFAKKMKRSERRKNRINILSGRFHLCLLSWKDHFSRNACKNRRKCKILYTLLEMLTWHITHYLYNMIDMYTLHICTIYTLGANTFVTCVEVLCVIF